MRNNTSTISITNASTANYANIDMNASTTGTMGTSRSVLYKARLKLQSGIDASALDPIGQSTATYFMLDSGSTVAGTNLVSDYRTAIYPNKLYLIGQPQGQNPSHLYLNDTGITCSSGWGGSSVTSLNTFLTNVTRCKQVQFNLASSVNITAANVDVLLNFNIRASTLTDIFSNQTLKSLFQNTLIEGVICTWVGGELV